MKFNKNFSHKKIWLDSMIGMTWGFFATLIVGSIVGLFSEIPGFNIFNDIKSSLTYMTGFGIGVGVGIKMKLNPIQILATGLGAFIVGQSLLVPKFVLATDSIDWTSVKFGINSKFLPGDVFGSWIAAVALIYTFTIFKWDSPVDIIIVPVIGIFIGVFLSSWLTYITSTLLALIELTIVRINLSNTLIILTAPVIGAIMGLALSLPTSSAAIAFSVHLSGAAGTAAIAGTAGQMISWGIMTYLMTGKLSSSLAVGFGSSMLQIHNFARKPILLLIPTIVSAMTALIATIIFMDMGFAEKSVTTGMGSAALYGQIFTMKELGWANSTAWLNVIFMQLLTPALLTVPLVLFFKNKGIIKPNNLELANLKH